MKAYLEVLQGIENTGSFLQRALSQLPMGELTALLRHMCQYMPIGANTGAAGRAMTAAASSDGVREHIDVESTLQMLCFGHSSTVSKACFRWAHVHS
jgi:hypothetical protein